MAGKADHVLDVPNTVFISRITQLVVAVVIMGLAAYGIYYLSFDAIDLTMFSAIATIIIAVYVIVASTAAPAAYNYWAIIGLDSFMVLFWVVSFAYLAYEVASVQLVTYDYCLYEYDGYCYYKNKRSLEIAKRATTTLYTYRNCMAAAAGLGGLEFLLFVKTLVFTSIWLHRHRKAGGHCMPYSPEAPPVEPQPMETVPVQQPVYQQPQQVYQQQPVYDQQQYQQQVYQQQPPQPVYQQDQQQPVYQQDLQQPVYQQQQQQPVYQQPYQPTA